MSLTNSSSGISRKKSSDHVMASESGRKSFASSRPSGALTGELTVKRLRLSKALTVLPETTTIQVACRRLAARRVDSLLLTDSNGVLCGILTDEDIATRVVARELNLEETLASNVMTRNIIFVRSDTLAVEALQKMVQGKFKRLPVVENGKVIALLDITKCLYDAIDRIERAAEKSKAIAAVEGVEKNWGTSFSGPNTFIETLRERMFRPSVSTILPENSKVVTVSPTDTVLAASKKMLEHRASSAVVTVDQERLGILTSKDILIRVTAQNLSPDSTLVEKVMTPDPNCASTWTPIVYALQIMHDLEFFHLPVVDKEGNIVAVLDIMHITHAAISMVGNTGGVNNEAASSMMQKFWVSAMALSPIVDDDKTRSDGSLKLTSEGDRSLPYHSSGSNTFSFKIEDKRGRMHRFTSDTRNLTELLIAILRKVGGGIDRNNLPQIMYEDEDHDKVVLESDNDLITAVEHAKSAGLKGLSLHLDYSGGSGDIEFARSDTWAAAYSAVAAGAALVAGLGVLAFLKRSS